MFAVEPNLHLRHLAKPETFIHDDSSPGPSTTQILHFVPEAAGSIKPPKLIDETPVDVNTKLLTYFSIYIGESDDLRP